MSDKERDELAELIANSEYPNMEPPWPVRKDRSPVKWYSRKTADAVLVAGYRKPRTITTTEELDALHTNSVVLSDGRVTWQKLTAAGLWVRPGQDMAGNANYIALPATVLHEPTA